MEDANTLAADCIVVSCCCQCMILKILFFILLKLPHKLVKKTRDYAKKLRSRKKGSTKIRMGGYEEEDSHGRIQVSGAAFVLDEPSRCMDEIERVLRDLSDRGEFSFGSFWCGGEEEDESSRSLGWCVGEEEIDYNVVRCRLMELFGSSASLFLHPM